MSKSLVEIVTHCPRRTNPPTSMSSAMMNRAVKGLAILVATHATGKSSRSGTVNMRQISVWMP